MSSARPSASRRSSLSSTQCCGGDIHAPEAWDRATGKGVVVAIIDTGIANDHPDLKGAKFAKGWNFISKGPNAYDDQGHGTHVAGTIAQTTNNGVGTAGLAFCATLMPVKVLSENDSV